MLALVRVAPLSHGHITIDCVDIATLPLKVLRSRIALVPQEPFIFAGTIRENMDPHGLHLDSSIWNVINQCLATPLVVECKDNRFQILYNFHNALPF